MTDVPVPIRMRLCIEDILRRRVPLFDGVDKLLGLAESVPPLAGDRDLRMLTGLRLEVDHLPIGKSRAHWDADALHRLDRELMELERRHDASVFYACRRLQQTLDRLPSG